jgi:hypothetical protein
MRAGLEEQGYAFYYRKAINELAIIRYGSSFATLGTKSMDLDREKWYKIKASCIGEELKLKFWDVADSEPVDWDIEVTNSVLTEGYFGVYDFDGSELLSYFRNFNCTYYKDIDNDEDTHINDFSKVNREWDVLFGTSFAGASLWRIVEFEGDNVLRHRIPAGSGDERSTFCWAYKERT